MSRLRITGTALVVAGLVLTSVGPAGAYARKDRYAGDDRVSTASIIAFNAGIRKHRIYLANAFTSADALAAGSLSDGPVLLVPGCGEAPERVRNYISGSFQNPTVTALGGVNAVCEQMLTSAAGDDATDRIAGADRYETAAKIALRAFPRGAREVYIANGDNSPDPVAGGVLRDGPMLLVRGDGAIPQPVLDAIATLDPERVVALGGTGAVSKAVLDSAAAGRQQHRLAGANRFETAVAISRYLWGVIEGESQTSQVLPARRAYLARSDVFADALAAGVVTDGPILLVPSCSGLPASVEAELRRLVVEEVVALGGRTAICDATVEEAARVQPEDGKVHAAFYRTNFLDGAVFAATEIVPMIGATVTHGTQSRVTDDAGRVVFDVQEGQEFTQKEFTITDAPAGFRDTEGTVTCVRGFFPEGNGCQVALRSFTVVVGPDRGPDLGGFPVWRDQTMRLVGPVEVSASLIRRPDNTFVQPMFTNLPDGEYRVFMTLEGCEGEFEHKPPLTVSGGLTGDGFSSRSDSGCDRTAG